MRSGYVNGPHVPSTDLRALDVEVRDRALYDTLAGGGVEAQP